MVGFVPLVPMLLTIKDGQGVPSDIDGAVRVIILSGAGDGQAVPQGARTVDCTSVSIFFFSRIHREHGGDYLRASANSYERESSNSELHDADGYLEKANGGLSTARKRALVLEKEGMLREWINRRRDEKREKTSRQQVCKQVLTK